MLRRKDELKICPSCGAIVRVLIRDLMFNMLHCHNCLATTSQQAKQTAKPN